MVKLVQKVLYPKRPEVKDWHSLKARSVRALNHEIADNKDKVSQDEKDIDKYLRLREIPVDILHSILDKVTSSNPINTQDNIVSESSFTAQSATVYPEVYPNTQFTYPKDPKPLRLRYASRSKYKTTTTGPTYEAQF